MRTKYINVTTFYYTCLNETSQGLREGKEKTTEMEIYIFTGAIKIYFVKFESKLNQVTTRNTI